MAQVKLIFPILLTVFLSLGGAYAARRSSARSPHQYAVAEKMVVPGIKDFGKVNEYLYRGAQPKPQGIEELKKLGIDTIVHLRGERRGLMEKERACGVLGPAAG